MSEKQASPGQEVLARVLGMDSQQFIAAEADQAATRLVLEAERKWPRNARAFQVLRWRTGLEDGTRDSQPHIAQALLPPLRGTKPLSRMQVSNLERAAWVKLRALVAHSPDLQLFLVGLGRAPEELIIAA